MIDYVYVLIWILHDALTFFGIYYSYRMTDSAEEFIHSWRIFLLSLAALFGLLCLPQTHFIRFLGKASFDSGGIIMSGSMIALAIKMPLFERRKAIEHCLGLRF